MCAGGFCISDNITSIAKIFEGNGVIFAEGPQDFREKIDYYLANENERRQLASQGQKFLLENHTNFHRISQILNYLGYEQEAANIVEGWDRTRREINA